MGATGSSAERYVISCLFLAPLASSFSDDYVLNLGRSGGVTCLWGAGTEDAKIKHLEFIQNTINRMAGNSFVLKGWSVTLISALFALAAKDSNPCFFVLAYFPAIAFWILDGYYLWQERLFRSLYDRVRQSEVTDFSLSTAEVIKTTATRIDTTISGSILFFHGVIVAVVSAATYSLC